MISKKIGTDLDKALSNGMTDIFKNAKSLFCTQNMQERDSHQLQTMGCNYSNKNNILADIYGCQNDVLLQAGLADADDPDDFDVKLESL